MKLKTHKATAKRFRITKTGKVMKKIAGQDHFNAREPGKVTRSKRRLVQISPAYQKTVKNLLPHT